MASLQWIICALLAAGEAVLLLALTIPSYHAIRKKTIPFMQRLLQPLLVIVPFSIFQLLDVYWKMEHKLSCGDNGQFCTQADRDRSAKSAIKNQRNLLLAVAALFLYWMLYRFVTLHATILRMESEIKKLKDA